MRQPLTDESLKRVCSKKDFVCKKTDSLGRFSYFQSGYVVATMASIFGPPPSNAKGKNGAFCGNIFGWLPGEWPMFPFAIYSRASHTHIVNTHWAPLRARRSQVDVRRRAPKFIVAPAAHNWILMPKLLSSLFRSQAEKNFWEFIQIYRSICASSGASRESPPLHCERALSPLLIRLLLQKRHPCVKIDSQRSNKIFYGFWQRCGVQKCCEQCTIFEFFIWLVIFCPSWIYRLRLQGFIFKQFARLYFNNMIFL